MRTVIKTAIGERPASHFGHAYEVLAPAPASLGQPDVSARETWLARCEQIAVTADYSVFYERWKQSFAPAGSRTREVGALSRLLIGHGNPSGSGVGLTVHHAWGVPVLPGSSLKGLVAHYIDAVYGAENPDEPERRAWRGPTWTGRRIAQGDGAGEHFAALFGAPAVDGEEDSARRGFVEFHDALYVSGSANGRPFARDVLTVHQKRYYDSQGREGPSDWDSPNPVGFLTVRTGARFLLA
ncbi:MAG: type III-B CRISPR module RAMP protein Cmr6, partial [Stellaceae bacterium]